MTKLQTLADIEGMDVTDMLADATFDSVAPGICKTPDCDYTTTVEPDCMEGWCEESNAGTLQSCSILAGII